MKRFLSHHVALGALALACGIVVAGCGGDDPGDAGGMDAGPIDAGPPPPCDDDSDCPGSYCNLGSSLCCVPAVPSYEICGDLIDQNCDRRDESCGDNDRDGVQACRPGEDPVGSGCDCDDERMDVRPRQGTLAGAPEACDGIDNDCNGRIDEVPQCCEVCDFLGTARDRADICTEDGVCDCSTDPGSGPCAEGRTCCAAGCVDVQTDVTNCGFCGAACTTSSDRCTGGECRCGDGEPCALDYVCEGGACPM